MQDKLIKNSIVNERLGVSNYQRKQMIQEVILEKPINFGGSYLLHTEQQIIRAQKVLAEKAMQILSIPRTIKSLSDKLKKQLRNK